MIRKIFNAVTIISALAFHQAASATTGNDLFDWLQEYKKFQRNDPTASNFKNGMALGYVSGISETTKGIGTSCVPRTVTNAQMLDIIYEALDRNPKLRHLEAAAIVRVTIEDAFPCAGK